jgi:hypothetical protein
VRTLLVVSIYLGAFFLFTACAQESGSLVAQDPQPYVKPVVIPPDTRVPQQQFPWVTLDGGESDTEFNPRVDILFVTDNSDSMKTAQENLTTNIDRFTNEIFKNKQIDYHIGVISTWDDSAEFSKNKKDTYGIGELRFAKTKGGQQLTKRYVDRSDEPSTLSETLKIGVAPLAEGGPENEVFFSPLLAALEKTGRGAANEEFFRQDAQLVVIFMTDADEYEHSTATAQQVVDAMVASKGGNAAKVSAYGVLVKANAPETSKDWMLRIHPKYHPECFDFDAKGKAKNNGKCSPFAPEKLKNFIFAVNEKVGATNEVLSKQFLMSILSPKFGDDLATIGGDIKRKTLEKEIFLGAKVPRQKNGLYQIRVRYGNADQLAKGKGRIIESDQKKGWSYNPNTNSVRLSGDISYEYVEGARFAIDLQVYQ